MNNPKIFGKIQITIFIVLLISWLPGTILAQCNLTATIQVPAFTCTNSILSIKSNGSENDRNYVWTVDDATILFGAGTGEIMVIFKTAGAKNITLQYQNRDGCVSDLAQMTIVVGVKPTFTTLSTPVVCEKTDFAESAPSVTGTYIAGSGFWSLDGVKVPSGYKWKYEDHGKLLQYNVETVGCDIVSSAGIAVTVNKLPSITSVTGLPVSLCGGQLLTASVDALGNGSTISGYQWWIENTQIGNSQNLSYSVVPSDNGKVVTVKVMNGCGTDSTKFTIAQSTGTKLTSIHDSLEAISPIPEGFIVQPVTPSTKRQLPDKYWENTTYRFITTASTEHNALINGSTVYLERDNGGVWGLVPTATSTSYTATVTKVTTLRFMPNVTNTTIILDKGSIPMGISTALQYDGLKIFGLGALGNSIIEGQTNEANYIRKKNMVLENLVFDGINFSRTSHFLRFQDDGADVSLRGDYMIAKNIKIVKVVQNGGGTFNTSPRGIFNIDDNNSYYEDGATSTITAQYEPTSKASYRYFINITIDASCSLVTQNYAYPMYCNSSKYDYIENLDIQMANVTYPVWIMQARNNSGEVSNSSGAVPVGVTMNGLTSVKDGIFVQMYQSKGITLPNDYRFLRFNTSNGTVASTTPATTAVTAYKTLPVPATNYAFYDRKDGYWIVHDGASRTISQQLDDIRRVYALTVTNKTPLPALNIKIIQNSSGTINGFTVPNFGSVPVNIVGSGNLDATIDKSGSLIPYSGTPGMVLSTTNTAYTNIHNFDFTQNVSYYLDTVNLKIGNAQPGNFYHCNFYNTFYNSDKLLKINAGHPFFKFGDASACAPDTVDLKQLTLVLGDTAGMVLKYFDDNYIRLTSTIVSTPGTTTYHIVGTTTGGCTYTSDVNVTIDTNTPTPVIFGPAITYVGRETNYICSNPEPEAYGYFWQTNQGLIGNGQGTDKTYISWALPGTDTIRLSYYIGACRGTGELEVKIINKDSLISSDFSIDNAVQCFEDNNYSFINTTTITPPNVLIGYFWDFGDGNTSTEANPTHRYARGGTYDVVLIAYGTIANDTVTKKVKVFMPWVERPSDQVVCENSETRRIILKGNADWYYWSGGESVGLADGKHPTHIPSFIAQNGTGTIITDTIIVTPVISEDGLTCYGDTVMFRITVLPAAIPTISGDTVVCQSASETYFTESGMSEYDWQISGGQIIAGGGPSDNYITVRWSTGNSGSVSVNYNDPDKCTTSKATAKTITLLSNVNFITQPASELAVCSGDPFSLTTTAIGDNLAYQWYFNGNPITGATGESYTITDSKPSESGEYFVRVSNACNTVQSNPSSVTIIMADIIVQKWENVLAVKCLPEENGGYQFKEFQWYRNGDMIPGETKSYLYVSGEIDYAAVYTVRLTTVSGIVFYTCGRSFIPKNHILVQPYPNPIDRGQLLNIEIGGIAESTPVECILTDYKGLILQKQVVKGLQAGIQMPEVPGIYILRVNINNSTNPESKYFKIIVK